MNIRKKIISRMAPSPTGHLHIGTARTALFNYLFAKHHGGHMILRSEDTDKERSKIEFEKEIIEGLKWLGIEWENKELYRQSERSTLYTKYLENAIKEGSMYISKEESSKNPGEMVELVRLKNPNKEITFNDVIRGDITFNTTELEDFVVARSVLDALYHFTVVVDDHDMEISHVIRGDDHISNTPRQILIQEALGFDRPIYAHLPLILAKDRSKMSKRHGAIALHDFIEEGFTKDTVINYLALLGWNPKTNKEIFTMEELIEKFDLDGIQKGGAIFDIEKMLWVNKEHLHKMDNKTYFIYINDAIGDCIKKLPQYSDERFEKLLPTIRERVQIEKEARKACEEGEYDFAFKMPKVNIDILKWKKDANVSDSLPRLNKVSILLEESNFVSPENIKEILWSYVEEVGKGEVLWPLRVALTGKERSPDPFTCAYIIGKEETLKRIRNAHDIIEKHYVS